MTVTAEALAAVAAGALILAVEAGLLGASRVRLAWLRRRARRATADADAALEHLRLELLVAYRLRDAAIAEGRPCVIDAAVIADAEAHLLDLTTNRKDPAP